MAIFLMKLGEKLDEGRIFQQSNQQDNSKLSNDLVESSASTAYLIVRPQFATNEKGNSL